MKRLCIVVPYRDREQHLSLFAPHINSELRKQGIEDYKILIVEQEDGKPFNRAKLLNVGFDFAKDYDYFVFHDVDMLPIESDYGFCPNPTHMASRAEQFGWKLPYDGYFGGVTLFDRESFVKINGYANEYWGWGAEDDDVFHRCIYHKIKVSRKNCSFRSLHHERKILEHEYYKNLEKLKAFQTNVEAGLQEGLSNLSYEILDTQQNELYTKITVKI